MFGITILKSMIASTNDDNQWNNALLLKRAVILNDIPSKSNVCDGLDDIVAEYDSCI
jgi:hypothetical protein